MKENHVLKRKRMSLVVGLLMTILVAFLGGEVVLAGTVPNNPTSKGDPIQTNNKHNKGLKSPHSARKQAAKRLRVGHQQQHQQKLQNWAKAHHGYTGKGQAGDGFSNNQALVNHGGAK
jgi:hypothetical protein